MHKDDSKKKDTVKLDSDLLDVLGGEQLEGSGFEQEIPEPSTDWRDPQ